MRAWVLGLFAATWSMAAAASSCEQVRGIIEGLRQGATVSAMTASAHVAAPVRVAWSRPNTSERIVAYLVIGFDKPVRFSGQHLYGLAPGAEAAYRIRRFEGMTRAIIPLYGEGAPRSAAFDVTFLTPGSNVLQWDVVGNDGCRESVGSGDGRRSSLTITPGGRPSLVIGDPIAKGEPADRFVSADGARLLEVFSGRYRLLEAATGAELAERAGTEPRFSPTGRFVGVKEQDGFAVLDAVDGARLSTTPSVGDIAWDNADSFVAMGGSQTGLLLSRNTLNGAAPLQGGSWLTARCCNAVDESAYRIDLENNLAVFSGPKGVIVNSLTNAKTNFEKTMLDQPELPAVRDMALRFALTASATRAFALPKVWEARGGLAFSHLGLPAPNDRSPAQKALARFLLQPRPGRAAQAIADTAPPALAASIGRGAWRGLQQEAGKAAVDRIVRRLADFGFAFMDTISPDEAVGRFEAGYQKELAKPLALRVAARITSEVPAARGRLEYVETNGTNCQPEQPGRLNSNINAARRWTVRGGKVWLTWLGCVEGNAAFNSPVLHIFDSTKRQVVEFADETGFTLKNPASDVAPACDFTVEACLANAELQGSRYIVLTSREGQAFAVYDLVSQKLLAKRFGASRGTLLDRLLLTPSARHAVQVNTDGTFFVLRLSDGAELLLGRVVDDEVVVALPDGRFDATAEGAELVRLRFPGQSGEHALVQFAAKLRIPGLLSAALSGQPIPEMPAVGTPPTLAASIERAGPSTIRVDAKAAGASPIAAIRVYQDGVFTSELAYPTVGPSSLTVNIPALPGARWVSAIAVDTAGIASVPIGRDLGLEGGRRRVHVVAAGVSRYDDPAIVQLPMPRNDAEAFAAALTAPTMGVSAAAAPVLLQDADASPRRIKDALSAAIDAAGPGETVALFFAGHGMRDEAGRLYLATTGSRLADIANTSLAWDELAPILNGAKGRVAVFLDTCHSGAAGTRFFATNDAVASALLAAVPSNIVIFSASKGRELAQETAAGGTFTRAVVDVIGAARSTYDLNRNGAIELSELYRGVKQRVRSITNGQQTPWFARNQMIGDFALF